MSNKVKIYLYENDQRELRLEVLPYQDDDWTYIYRVDNELVNRYNQVMNAYNAMQDELRKIKGE